MRTLLVATDLSERSERAVARAMMMAKERDAAVVVLHVVDEDLPPDLAKAQITAAKDVLIERRDALAAGDRPRVAIEVTRGRPHKDIGRAARRHAAEIVVLGTHREDLWRDVFRGTTAERVVRTSSVPVLLVRDRVNELYRRILVAVDFSLFSRRAIEFVADLLPRTEIELVHAYHVPFEGFLKDENTREQMATQTADRFRALLDEEMTTFLANLSTRRPNVCCVIQEGTVQGVIASRVRETAPDLLVIGTHGKTWLDHAFLGSVAEELLRSPPCDVLAVGA